MAREFGITNVDAMLNSMSATQYRRWIAYFSTYGFSDDRADLRHGFAAAQIAASLYQGRKRRTFKVADFMPPKPGPKRKQTPAEMGKLLTAFAAVHNASLAAGGKKRG